MTSPTLVPGFPRDRLVAFLNANLPEFAEGPHEIELLTGGRSNLTARLTTPNGSVVLRRPPLSHVLATAHDMGREYRVMEALVRTPVPVPTPLALCSDVDVIGAPFQVLEFVDGLSVGDAAQAAAIPEDERGAVSQMLVDTLAALHAVDPETIGLGNLGNANGYLRRQVSRWRRQWDSSKTREIPVLDSLAAGLEASVPLESRAALVHGDFRLDNVLVDRLVPSKALAVVDWEMATLGDPLADLALTLLYWHEPSDVRRARVPIALGVTTGDGFWDRSAVVDRYAAVTGADISALNFYLGLACFKFAVILEGIHARHLAGGTVGEGFDGLDIAVPALADLGTVALHDGLEGMSS